MNFRDFYAWQTLSWFFCCVCLIFYLCITHSIRTHTFSHTRTHVCVYATLHPQHRKTYYDDDVDVDSGGGSSALRSVHCSARLGYYTFVCVCACMGVRLMSVGSSRSLHVLSLSLLLLLHASTFCAVTFHTQFRFLFNSPLPLPQPQPSATACTCIFVCYFVAPLLLLPDLRESFNERQRENSFTILYSILCALFCSFRALSLICALLHSLSSFIFCTVCCRLRAPVWRV